MRDNYHVWCLDCEIGLLGVELRTRETARALVTRAEDLMRIGVAIDKLVAVKAPFVEPQLRVNGYQQDAGVDVAWFVRHFAHRLTVRDDYGRCDEECQGPVDCFGCGSSHWCRLPRDHEGDCSSKRSER